MTDSVRLRPLNADDVDELNHVRKTWMRHAADSPFAVAIGKHVFIEDHLPWRDRILGRASVLVACLADQPEAVCGWACTETQGTRLVLHFVHVKRRWRNLGIARQLLAPLLAEPIAYSHRTSLCGALPIPASWQFRPHAAFWIPDPTEETEGDPIHEDLRIRNFSADRS